MPCLRSITSSDTGLVQDEAGIFNSASPGQTSLLQSCSSCAARLLTRGPVTQTFCLWALPMWVSIKHEWQPHTGSHDRKWGDQNHLTTHTDQKPIQNQMYIWILAVLVAPPWCSTWLHCSLGPGHTACGFCTGLCCHTALLQWTLAIPNITALIADHCSELQWVFFLIF